MEGQMFVKANIFAESSGAPEHRELPVLGVPTTTPYWFNRATYHIPLDSLSNKHGNIV